MRQGSVVLSPFACRPMAHVARSISTGYPQAFGVVDRAKGLILAQLAGLALSLAEAHDEEDLRADNLQAGLITQEVIGQA